METESGTDAITNADDSDDDASTFEANDKKGEDILLALAQENAQSLGEENTAIVDNQNEEKGGDKDEESTAGNEGVNQEEHAFFALHEKSKHFLQELKDSDQIHIDMLRRIM